MRHLLWIVCGVVCVVSVNIAWAKDASLCKAYYAKGQFIRASGCYGDLAKVLELKRIKTNDDLSLINQFLRNAALCMRREAQRETSAVKKSYLYERALLFVSRIVLRRYHKDMSQRRLAITIRDQVREKVGYVQLTLTTGGAKGTFELTGGYRFPKQIEKGSTWQGKLRPGSYSVLCKVGKQTAVKLLSVKAGQAPVVHSFRKALRTPVVRKRALSRVVLARRKPIQRPNQTKQPTPKTPTFPIGFVLGGSIVAAVGVGLAIAGVATNIDNNAQAQTYQTSLASFNVKQAAQTSEQRSAFVKAHELANVLFGAGLATGAIGVTGLVVGLVLLNKQQPATTVRQPRRTNISTKMMSFLP